MSPTMLVFNTVEKMILNSDETLEYLNLRSKSTLENLVRLGRLTPLRISRENLYARSELDDFIKRELAEARRLKGASDT